MSEKQCAWCGVNVDPYLKYCEDCRAMFLERYGKKYPPICRFCGAPFKDFKKHDECDSCKTKHTHTCYFCNCTFYFIPYPIDECPKCREQHRKTGYECMCQKCGSAFRSQTRNDHICIDCENRQKHFGYDCKCTECGYQWYDIEFQKTLCKKCWSKQQNSKKPTLNKTCKECGKTFGTVYENQIYCSDKCRNAKYGGYEYVEDGYRCVNCHQVFDSPNWTPFCNQCQELIGNDVVYDIATINGTPFYVGSGKMERAFNVHMGQGRMLAPVEMVRRYMGRHKIRFWQVGLIDRNAKDCERALIQYYIQQDFPLVNIQMPEPETFKHLKFVEPCYEFENTTPQHLLDRYENWDIPANIKRYLDVYNNLNDLLYKDIPVWT